VLSAGQTIQTDNRSQTIAAPVVTLLVTPQEAEALTLANTEGHIQLVLRNSTDQKTAVTQGRQWRDLYGAPEPPAVTALPVTSRRPASISRETAILPVAAVPAPAPDQMVLIHGHVRTVTVFGKEGESK